MFTPALRALLSKIAVFCAFARVAPNLRRVLFTIAGGFAFISEAIAPIVLLPLVLVGSVPLATAVPLEVMTCAFGEGGFLAELAASV